MLQCDFKDPERHQLFKDFHWAHVTVSQCNNKISLTTSRLCLIMKAMTRRSSSRLSVLLNQTLPKEARELNGHEHLGVRVAKDSNVGRRYQHDEFGRIHGACWDAATGVYPREAAVDENRTISIPPNSKKIVSCSPIGGIWDSNMCWPLSAASLTYELTLESAMDQILAGATPAHGTAAAPLGTGYGRSQQFQILLPRMEYSQVHLSSQAQSEYDSLLASTGLNMSLNSYHTMVANVVDRSPRVSFSRSLANIKDCLLYTSPSPRDVEESRMPAWG